MIPIRNSNYKDSGDFIPNFFFITSQSLLDINMVSPLFS